MLLISSLQIPVAPYTIPDITGSTFYMALLSSTTVKVPVTYTQTPDERGDPWGVGHMPRGDYVMNEEVSEDFQHDQGFSFFYRTFRHHVYFCYSNSTSIDSKY